MYSKEKKTGPQRDTFILMFIEALLTIAKEWKQPMYINHFNYYFLMKQYSLKFLPLLLLLLSCLSHVRLCATLQRTAHQAPPSLGFSRQEYWSGLPFPSPMHKSEKWKWSHSVMSTLATPRTAAYQAPPSMGFSRQKYWSGLPLPSPEISRP